ncbi:UrcA family protein [Sphingosinicellaceae bacterium]|nr:UrcA family protein [Sphingosinicellaceae bacterium]
MFVTSSFARNFVSAASAALIATACLTIAVAPAAAATAAPMSKTVSYADLNLANAQGRAALNARIKSAARSVCKVDGRDLQARTSETRCIKDAVRNASVS